MSLHVLMQHIRSCPAEFFLDASQLSLGAIVSDLLIELGGGAPNPAALNKILHPDTMVRNQILLVLCWVFSFSGFRDARNHAPAVARVLARLPTELAPVTPDKYSLIHEPDRCEELARLVLKGLGLSIEGENAKASQARLEEISTVERERVAKETREKMEAKQKIEEELKKKAAEEAAARAWHE